MLCRSIAVKGYDKIVKLLKGAEMAEIRIEKSGLSASEVKSLFENHANLLATCRSENNTDEQRTKLLTAAIEGGAKWIDIEIESEKAYMAHLVALAKSKECKVIISYHNYDATPDATGLNAIINDCREKGADLIKLATTCNTTIDTARLMGVYSLGLPILSIGMGKLGSITRVAALKLGAPFTFVSCDNEEETAPGQYTESEMKNILKCL